MYVFEVSCLVLLTSNTYSCLVIFLSSDTFCLVIFSHILLTREGTSFFLVVDFSSLNVGVVSNYVITFNSGVRSD